MADPVLVWLNGLAINDLLHYRLLWQKAAGIFAAAAPKKPSTIETFGADVRVHSDPLDYQPRGIKLPIRIIGQGSFLAKQQARDALSKALATRPVQLQVGTLYCEPDLYLYDEPEDDYKKLPDKATVMVEGEAVPPLWDCRYGYAVGVAQGIPVLDDRPDHASYAIAGAAASAWVSVTNPGTAVSPTAAMVSGLTASTLYTVENAHQDLPQKVSFTTDASGAAYINVHAGLYLMPGANVLKVRTSAGVIVTSALKWGFLGMRPRFQGNGPSSDTAATTGRFGEPPAVFTHFRTGFATSFTAAATQTTSGDMAARIGDALYKVGAAGSPTASKTTNNTKLAISSSSGGTAGTYNLRSVLDAGGPPQVTITWDGAVYGPYTGWGGVPFPLTVVGNTTGGTLVLADNGGPPGAPSTNDDTVTVAATTGGAVFTTANVGLILEPEATQLSIWSEDFSNAAWVEHVVGSKVATNASDPAGGTTAVKIDMSVGAGAGIRQDTSTAWGTNVNSWAIWLKGDSGNEQMQILLHTDAGGSISSRTVVLSTTWKRYTLSGTGGGAGNIRIRLSRNQASGFFYAAFSQLNAGPIPMSYTKSTSATVVRKADYCYVAKRNNYAQYARKLGTPSSSTFQAPWTKVGTANLLANAAGADGTATAQTLDFDAASDSCYQIFALDRQPSTSPWCMAVRLRKAAAGAVTSFVLNIKTSTGSAAYADHSTTLVTATIPMSDFPDTTTSRTYFITGTPAATAISVLGELIRGGTNGSVVVEAVSFGQGSVPPPFEMTEGAAVPKPAHGWEHPDGFAQNLELSFRFLLPPISTGLSYGVIGDYDTAKLALYRLGGASTGQNYLQLDAATNGSNYSSGSIDVGAVWDSSFHTAVMRLKNYRLSGTQYMIVELDIDGVNKLTSANLVTATTTRFTAPERLWLSDGKVLAVLRGVSGTPLLAAPALPVGAVPVTT